jgi:hypothetical protein
MSKGLAKNSVLLPLLLIVLIVLISGGLYYIYYNLNQTAEPAANAVLNKYDKSLEKIEKVVKAYRSATLSVKFDLLKLSVVNLPLEIGLVGKANPFAQPPAPEEELLKLIQNP